MAQKPHFWVAIDRRLSTSEMTHWMRPIRKVNYLWQRRGSPPARAKPPWELVRAHWLERNEKQSRSGVMSSKSIDDFRVLNWRVPGGLETRVDREDLVFGAPTDQPYQTRPGPDIQRGVGGA